MLGIVATFATLALGMGQQSDTVIPVQPGTRLDVSNFSGGIVVKAWSQNAVRVHAQPPSGDVIEVVLESSVLSVKTSSRHGTPEDVEYIIMAPAWMALNLRGVHSDIDVDGAQAAVRAETVEGAVNCRGGTGYVSLKSVSGAIALHEAKGRVEVNTVSDDISLVDVAGDVSAMTVSGGIELKGIQSSRVDVSTVSGDVVYSGTITDGGHYRFTTHSGNVKLGIPEKANAAITVSTFNGDFESTFPVGAPAKTTHRFSFTVGSGSAGVELETFSGDITLRRPGEMEKEED